MARGIDNSGAFGAPFHGASSEWLHVLLRPGGGGDMNGGGSYDGMGGGFDNSDMGGGGF